MIEWTEKRFSCVEHNRKESMIKIAYISLIKKEKCRDKSSQRRSSALSKENKARLIELQDV